MEKDDKKTEAVEAEVAETDTVETEVEAKKPTPKPARKTHSRPKPVVYRALSGITYSGKHANTGDLLEDIPASSVEWLLKYNYIEKVED